MQTNTQNTQTVISLPSSETAQITQKSRNHDLLILIFKGNREKIPFDFLGHPTMHASGNVWHHLCKEGGTQTLGWPWVQS